MLVPTERLSWLLLRYAVNARTTSLIRYPRMGCGCCALSSDGLMVLQWIGAASDRSPLEVFPVALLIAL